MGSYRNSEKGDDSKVNTESNVGFFYIIAEQIQDKNTGLYKIGRTKNLKRIYQLQTGNARFLDFYYWAVVNNMKAAEKVAMSAVSKYRARDGGGIEWYDVAPEDLKHFFSLVRHAIRPYCIS